MAFIRKTFTPIESNGKPIQIEAGVLLGSLFKKGFGRLFLKDEIQVHRVSWFGATEISQELIRAQVSVVVDKHALRRSCKGLKSVG